ncbi:MAG: AAA family ATPase [Streptosporangiaceae bacterium]
MIAGLPGSGKSAVADDLARALSCAVLSVDQVAAALWRAGISTTQPTPCRLPCRRGVSGRASVLRRRAEFPPGTDEPGP